MVINFKYEYLTELWTQMSNKISYKIFYMWPTGSWMYIPSDTSREGIYEESNYDRLEELNQLD